MTVLSCYDSLNGTTGFTVTGFTITTGTAWVYKPGKKRNDSRRFSETSENAFFPVDHRARSSYSKTMTRTAANQVDLTGMNFGIEIETLGITVPVAARAIRDAVYTRGPKEGEPVFPGATVCTVHRYNTGANNAVRLTDGREWICCFDGSLTGTHAEAVSPIMKYEELEIVQEVARALKKAGARSPARSTGIHIHIDGFRTFTPKQIGNLAKLVNQQEDLMVKALQVDSSRRNQWAREVEGPFIERLVRTKPTTREALRHAWFGHEGTYEARSHYNDGDGTRYRGINLHSLWFRGTVEFRYFNGTLHAGKIKAYVQFVLALASKAAGARAVATRKRILPNGNEKYAVRTFLIRIGLNGDEFKTCRHHLLKHLPGDASRSAGRPEASARINAQCEGGAR